MAIDKERLAVSLLQEKAKELGRLPQKSDFEIENTMLIKQKLGPWTRALEKAGLKPVSEKYLEKKARNKLKRKQKGNVKAEPSNQVTV